MSAFHFLNLLTSTTIYPAYVFHLRNSNFSTVHANNVFGFLFRSNSERGVLMTTALGLQNLPACSVACYYPGTSSAQGFTYEKTMWYIFRQMLYQLESDHSAF